MLWTILKKLLLLFEEHSKTAGFNVTVILNCIALKLWCAICKINITRE